jgi:surface antigen
MKKNLVIGTLLISTIVSAAAPALADKETVGNVIGGILGGVLGNQVGKGHGRTAATIIGAIAGTVIGGKIGEDLDENDRRQCVDAQRRGLGGRLGERSEWRGQRGSYGHFTTSREGYNRRTQEYCREYVSTIYSGGRTEETRGIACTRRDGSWYEVQQTEVSFDGRGNGGYGGRDRWEDNRPGRRDDRRDDYRPAPPAPSREELDRAEVRGVTRRSGGEWVRLTLRRPVDVSRVEVRTQGAGLIVYDAKAYSASGRPVDVRGLGNARLRPGSSVVSESLRSREEVSTIDILVESMGGFADVEFTVYSNNGRPSIDASRY